MDSTLKLNTSLAEPLFPEIDEEQIRRYRLYLGTARSLPYDIPEAQRLVMLALDSFHSVISLCLSTCHYD